MNSELPMVQQIQRWLEQRVTDVDRFLLPAADAKSIAALERTIGRALPDELRAWFVRHAGTTEALSFMENEIERVPYWPLLTPPAIARVFSELRAQYDGWLPSWLPLSVSSSGSVTWYLCCELSPAGASESGAIVLLDDADSDYFEPHPIARGMNAYFAPLARSMERGDIVAVGFDDEEDAPPELMTRAAFDRLAKDRQAYLLPRTEPREVATCDELDEGVRFLHMLIARSQLVLTDTESLPRLGRGVGKLLQSPRPTEARAHAVCEWLAEQPEVEEIYATDHEVGDLLEVW